MIEAALFIINAVIAVLEMLWHLVVWLGKTVLEVWDWITRKSPNTTRHSN